jgi:quercetin dioxygenase-like cupin family protein
MMVRTSGKMRSRAILKGETHSKFPVDLHETELAAGQAPHPPHRHVHEEILMVRSGMVTVNIAGEVSELGAGGLAYIASNEEHGWRNTGSTDAEYFVLALGDDK